MADHIKAWECIGCGKIEAPQECLGVCKDRKVEFVYAAEYEAALAELEQERQRSKALAVLARQLAWSTPNEGGWERSYRAMQEQARKILATLAEPARTEAANESGMGEIPLEVVNR